MSLFQSNLRKQITNLPKILKFVKKIHSYSKLFTSLLNPDSTFLPPAAGEIGSALQASGRRPRSAGRPKGGARVVLEPSTILQILEGSFSAVSKPDFVSKYAFESF